MRTNIATTISIAIIIEKVSTIFVTSFVTLPVTVAATWENTVTRDRTTITTPNINHILDNITPLFSY